MQTHKPGMREILLGKLPGKVREDARRDAVWKMRTDARRESIPGTRAQLWKFVLFGVSSGQNTILSLS